MGEGRELRGLLEFRQSDQRRGSHRVHPAPEIDGPRNQGEEGDAEGSRRESQEAPFAEPDQGEGCGKGDYGDGHLGAGQERQTHQQAGSARPGEAALPGRLVEQQQGAEEEEKGEKTSEQ